VNRQDFVTAWKADPSKVTIGGGSSPGGPDHLFPMEVAQAVGVDPKSVNFITYDGGGDLLTALLGKKVTVGTSSPGELIDQIEAGLERVRQRMATHGFEFEEGDEDIHMAIERLLGEEIGPVAGKVHTGRSRNDQVATDVAMVVQVHSLRAIELCGEAMAALLEQAATVARTEVFGPVITVQTFTDEAEAIEIANDTPYGLTASVWTQNHGRALRVSAAIDTGCVWVNCHIPLVAEMPHGGAKQSGYGGRR